MQVTFVMEQHIGHRSYYQNLRRFVDQQTLVTPHWVEVTYEDPGYLWDALSFIPSNLRGSMIGRVQVRRGLQQHAYDVAVFNTQVPAALSPKLVKKRPYVLCTDITPIQYDGMADHYGHQPDRKGIIQSYKHRVNTNLMRSAARILPWSTWTRSSLINDYSVDSLKIEVIPPGVDLHVWRPDRSRRGKPVRILFVGGDLFRKGGDLLMKAFQQIQPGKAELVLVTRTELPQSERIRIYNNMQPNSPDLIALYQSCDIFVLPTKAEAFGIAAVEASATGLPVIATRVGGLQDIVVDGETGFLLSTLDLHSLVKHLKLLVDNDDLRQKMGIKCREHVRNHFNAQSNAERMVEILLEIVQQ